MSPRSSGSTERGSATSASAIWTAWPGSPTPRMDPCRRRSRPRNWPRPCGRGRAGSTRPAPSPDGRVVVIRDDYDTPQQIAIVGAGTDQVLASLAHVGTDYLRSVAGSATNVAWSAPDGTEIEGVLCAPTGAGPFPLVL